MTPLEAAAELHAIAEALEIAEQRAARDGCAILLLRADITRAAMEAERLADTLA